MCSSWCTSECYSCETAKNNTHKPTALLIANMTCHSIIVFVLLHYAYGKVLSSVCAAVCVLAFVCAFVAALVCVRVWAHSRGAALLSHADRVAGQTDDVSLWRRRAQADGWPVLGAGTGAPHRAEMMDVAANFKHRELNGSCRPLLLLQEVGHSWVTQITHKHRV